MAINIWSHASVECYSIVSNNESEPFYSTKTVMVAWDDLLDSDHFPRASGNQLLIHGLQSVNFD